MPVDPLDYASGTNRRSDSAPVLLLRRAGSWLRRNRRRVVLGATIVLASALVAALVWIPWLRHGSRSAYQLHRMLTFSLPPTTVVFEEDPVVGARLLAIPPDPATAYVGVPHALDYPVAAGDYSGRPGGMEYLPRFYQIGTYLGGDGGLVFIHQLVNPAGGRRMVIVTDGVMFPNHPGPRYDVRDALRVTIRSCPADKPFHYRTALGRRYPESSIRIPMSLGGVARLYAGQLDPSDPSRLTIKYEIDDVPGTIEGKLEADDSVTLKVLDGPAATAWKPLVRRR